MIVSRRSIATRLQVLVATLAGKPIIWLAFIVAMFSWPILRSIRAERDLPHTRPTLGRVRDFTLRDQGSIEIRGTELRGRIWVASFTTVDCETACEQSRHMLMKMAEVRHRARNLGDAFRLVTFTREPDRDTPERMLELAVAFRASHGSWRFVSGPPEQVREVLDDFHVAEDTAQTRIALVDGDLLIRGFYDLSDEAALPLLLRDISRLLSPRRE